MIFVTVKDGNEDLIARAVQWLDEIGIPREQIRRVSVEGQVGQPLVVSVNLYVPEQQNADQGVEQ